MANKLLDMSFSGEVAQPSDIPAISTDISADASSDSKAASPKAVKTYVDAAVGGASLVQEQADWNQTNSSEPDYIKNKPAIPGGSSASPQMDGTASAGSSTDYARGDHVHPSDTSRQAKIAASGILKGDGSGGVTAAVAGIDYLSSSDVSISVLVANASDFDDTSDAQVPTSNAVRSYVSDVVGSIESALSALR